MAKATVSARGVEVIFCAATFAALLASEDYQSALNREIASALAAHGLSLRDLDASASCDGLIDTFTGAPRLTYLWRVAVEAAS